MRELAAGTIPFLHTLADIRVPFLDSFFSVLTYLGDEKLFVVIALIIFWCFSKRGGLYMITVGFGASSIGQALKMVSRIPRPWVLDETMEARVVPSARESNLLGEGADGWSFPSGHTLISVGTYGGMAAWFKQKGIRILGIVLAVLIPFSRMYLGVHTPLDIVLGTLLALALVLLLRPVFRTTGAKAVRAVLIGNIILSIAVLVWMYGALPGLGLQGGDLELYAHGVKNLWQLVGATIAVEIAFEVDERRLHFDTRAVWWAQLLKIGGGCIIVLVLQVGIQKVLGYAKPITADNMTRNGIIACIANLAALTCGMAVWPMTFKWFSRLGDKAKA